MNITFEREKKIEKPIVDPHPPLMVNGRTLVKLQSLRSKSRTNVSSFEILPKYEVPEKDLSFISEILGKNIEKSSWLLTAFQRRPHKKLEKLDKEEDNNSSAHCATLSAPNSLPQINEKGESKAYRFMRTVKKSSVIIKHPKLPIDSYNKHINLLQVSNGFEAAIQKKEYKYFIGSGNNDSLVNKIMRKKSGWTKVYTYHSAHFVWTQVRKLEILQSLPQCLDLPVKQSSPKPTSFSMFSNEELIALSPLNQIIPSKSKVYNRIERNYELSSKKRLFANMVAYYKTQNLDPFDHIPLTFHITNGSRDPNFGLLKSKFLEFQEKIAKESDSNLNNLWLVKPGESTNRGIGISICSTLQEIESKLEYFEYAPGKNRTYIVQKYVYRPLLYFGRKFDIRCYVLVLCYNGNLQAFFYRDGYLRTAVAEFSMENNSNKFIHLTNDAVQKKSAEYGKFEAGNKLSYAEFQEYLTQHCDPSVNFFESIFPKILKIVKDTISATCMKLDAKKRLNTFEVLGYDFMIDELYKPWLIEANTNPCLALSGGYLASLIPKMLEDALHIALDCIFQGDVCDFGQNRFVLVYNRGKQVEETQNLEACQSDGEIFEDEIEVN